MNPLDIYVHCHTAKQSQCALSRQYEGYHLVAFHNISAYFSFNNISQEFGNNVLFYEPGFSIVIPDGCYSLTSLNKYIDNVGVTALFRIVPAYNGKTYQVKKYANTTNKALDVGGVVQNVSTLSKLNKQINNKSAFTERIKIWCDFIRAGTNDINTGTLTSSSWYIVPITCEPGQHFLYSFY